jgi:hypothetical protein
MWTMYKRLLRTEDALDKRDLLFAQAAFYTGARGIVRVLARLVERGDYDELHSIIKAHNRLLTRLQARHLRARRH